MRLDAVWMIAFLGTVGMVLVPMHVLLYAGLLLLALVVCEVVDRRRTAIWRRAAPDEDEDEDEEGGGEGTPPGRSSFL